MTNDSYRTLNMLNRKMNSLMARPSSFLALQKQVEEIRRKAT